jgi:hypothetical protein
MRLETFMTSKTGSTTHMVTDVEDLVDLVWKYSANFHSAARDELIEQALMLIEDHGLDSYDALRSLLNIPATALPTPLTDDERKQARERRERARQRTAEVVVARPPPADGIVQAGEGARYTGPAKFNKPGSKQT